MGKRWLLLFATFMLFLFLFYAGVNKIAKKKQSIVKGDYDISSLIYSENNINITYPCISGLQNKEIQNKVNNLLKKDAFRELELQDLPLLEKGNLENIALSITYQISFQDNEYLSVKYLGDIYVKDSVYPRSIFTTINIDLNNGNRLKLRDITNIDHEFVEKVREKLRVCIDENQDWSVLCKEKLEYDEAYIIKLFMQADAESNSDCFSYFTKDQLGISFSTAHAAGDHFEIELEMKDALKYLRDNK